jgi:CubicO group peptidase (beta-lactamase class C family)
MFIRFLLPFLLTVSVLSAQQVPNFAPYTKFLKKEIAGGQIAGAVSLVVRDGKVIHEGAWGMSDVEAEVPMTQDKIFHLMSMTKPIVSVAVMMLWEQNKFRLDAPISYYLDGFENLRVANDLKAGKDGPVSPALELVTVRQLLTHTAGFSHGLGGTKLDNDFARAMYYEPQANIESRVKTMTSLPLVGQPGQQWSYSASPDVIALLIEKLSGMPLDEYLQQHIFEPLGMTDTGYNMTEEQAARMPKLYKSVNDTLVRDKNQMAANGHTVFGGSHGLLGTAADYAKFCQMLLNGGELNGKRILKPETIRTMTRSHIGELPYRPSQTFGLGFGINTVTPADHSDSKGRYYWSGAYSTFFFVDPANNLFAILMTQTSPFTSRYGDALREYVYKAIW